MSKGVSPVAPTRVVQGAEVPAFFYGTAWKEARTRELATLALETGFRAIDTANQRRHYVETAVGEAVVATMSKRGLARSDIFLQTKFTHPAGHDERISYDPAKSPAAQVLQSFESSLEHLQTSYVDAYLLHGPSGRSGLSRADREAWRAMEELCRAGRTRFLGISNVSLAQLSALHGEASVKPAFVQNRCFASTGWDSEVRRFCRENGIVYQGFSLLTANKALLEGPVIHRMAERAGRSPAQVVFRFALQAGMIPLTGTSSALHMKDDLGTFDFVLDAADADAIERAGSP